MFAKWTILLTLVAEIVTLYKDSLDADWILIITGIDANIEYTIVVDNMQYDQNCKENDNSCYWLKRSYNYNIPL